MKSQFLNHSADSTDISESYLKKNLKTAMFFILTMIIFSQTRSSTSQYAEMISSLACY